MILKRTFFAALAIIVLAACQQKAAEVKTNETGQTQTAADSNAAVITFEKEVHEFGSVKEGEKVNYDFKFKNTGKSPLIIASAEASCGCTVPETPKEPILPGQEGVIKVVFDSNGRQGLNDKVITVTSNAVPAQSRVHLVGEVKPAK